MSSFLSSLILAGAGGLVDTRRGFSQQVTAIFRQYVLRAVKRFQCGGQEVRRLYVLASIDLGF